jgi:site-specific DNA-adenine methylase
MPFKTVLRWPGGKSRAVGQFTNLWQHYFPEARVAYSPFLGGGSFELVLASELRTKVVTNDCFCLLMDFWKAMKSHVHRARMARFVRANHPLSRAKYNTWVAKAKDRSSFTAQFDLGTRGAMAYLITRASFSGRIAGGWSRTQAAEKLRSLQDWYTDNDGATMFGRLTFACSDWSAFLKKHPTAGTRSSPLYVDPPYMLKERSRQQLYGFNNELHRDFDHVGLRRELGRRGYWMLCYNNTPEVRKLYAGYKFVNVRWAYSMQNKTQEGSSGTESREIVIISQGTKIPYGTRA